MKKSLLAIAVISAATMASAEVKLSGDVTVDYTSVNGSRATFGESGSEINIDASQDIGGGNTVYAHAELELDGHNKTGGIVVDEGRVGIKGSWGDLQLGDTGTACDKMLVGGGNEQVLDPYALAGCYDSGTIVPGALNGGTKIKFTNVADQGIRYTSPEMSGFKGSISYHPDEVAGEDVVSLGVQGEMGPVKGSLGYSEYKGSGVNTFAVGLEGKFGDFKAGAQYSTTDYDAVFPNVDMDAWEINLNYDLASGSIYGSYGEAEVSNGSASVDTDGWMLGYTHNISNRTWTWIEIGESEGDKDTSYSTGLGHKF